MRLTAQSLRFRWQTASVAVGGAVALLFTVHPGFPLLSDLDLRIQDQALQRTTTQDLPHDFLLVGLDDASLAADLAEPEEVAASPALQKMKEGFPWSREVYALAARKALNAGARLVLFDFVFPGPNPGDASFAAFMRDEPGRFVVGAQFDGDTYRKPTSVLEAAAGEGVGFVNMAVDRGVIRSTQPFGTISSFQGLVPLEGERVESSLAAVAAGLLGHPLPQSLHERRFRYSRPGSVETASLQELFIPAYWQSEHRNWGLFKDRVVLIGPTAEGLKDFHETPMGRMSGPEVQLHILAAMLRGSWLRSAPAWAGALSVLGAAMGVLTLAAWRKSPAWFLFWLAAGAVLWTVTFFGMLWGASYFLPVAPPLAAWLGCGVLALACDATLENRERTRLRRTLERYVSKDMVREVVDNPASYLQSLGGQRKEIVTLFCDLKGFTADSETRDAGELVALLNHYFAEMVSAVFEQRGTLDKFMGDALMATWGALNSESPGDDARNALHAAFEMRARLAAINSRRNAGAHWSAGMGITQGQAVYGNIGCDQKMDLTAIGDSVNLASRLQALTRLYGCDLLVDSRMAESLDGVCQFLPVDLVRVRGRRKSEMLYAPYPGGEPAAWDRAFREARADYLAGNFAQGREAFDRLAQDGLFPAMAALFSRRCADFLVHPPRADWDGVWDFSGK